MINNGHTTQVTLVVCKRTAIKVKTKDARVGANPAQSDLSCGSSFKQSSWDDWPINKTGLHSRPNPDKDGRHNIQ